MKRFWPLAFLILLFGALALRPVPEVRKPAAPRPVREPVVRVEPQSAPEPSDPVPPTRQADPAPEPPQESHEQAMKRSAVGAGLLWLARHQNEDGSFGDGAATIGGRTIGKPGITALAILSFLGAGYSQLSKDEFDGDKSIGETVKKSLKWFLRDMGEDGTFQSGHDVAFDQVLACLALSEAYGMTAAQPLKEPAEKALAAMYRMQGSDGSWGGPEVTAWAVHAVASAELSELPSPREVQESLLRYIDAVPHPGNVLNRIMLTKKRESVAAEAAALASSLPQGGSQDFLDWLHVSYSVFQYAGPESPMWKSVNEPMKQAILPLQDRNGSWQGGTGSHTVVRTSLAELTLQVYYRYANIYGSTAR